jgi:hypothetical protein
VFICAPAAAVAEPPTPTTLAQCQKELALAREGVSAADDLLTLAKEKRVVFLPQRGGVGLVPINPTTFTQLALANYAAGKISSQQLTKALVQFGKFIGKSVKVAGALLEEATAERDRLEGICAKLAAPPKSSGTGTPTPEPAQGTPILLTLDGTTVTGNLNGTQTPAEGSPGATIRPTSGQPYKGTVTVKGELPSGDVVYIEYHSQTWAVLSASGGDFTVQESAGSGPANDVDVLVCPAGGKQGGPLPNNCVGKAVISIYWQTQ